MFKNPLKWLAAATVIFIMLVSCGGATTTKAPMQQRPRIGLPSIQVTALYPGADIRTVLDSVASPLKDSIFHYAESMDHMTFTANNDGSLIITVYFKQDVNLDLAAVKIQNLVAVVSGQLPSAVVQSGIPVLKQNEPIVMAVDLYPEDTGHYDQAFLANYAATNIANEIQHTPGVSRLITFNKNNDSLLRIWLNKEQLAALNLTLEDVLAAIPAAEAVTGVLYKNSKQPFDYIIKCKLIKYGNMTIRTNAGTALQLKDAAVKVEAGPHTYGNFTRTNGKPGISMVVMQRADSNYNDVQTAVKNLMEKASKSFPAGIKHSILYNPQDSLYISAE